MLSGIIFILISWLVPGFPLWLSIVLTVYGSLLFMLKSLKILIVFIKEGHE